MRVAGGGCLGGSAISTVLHYAGLVGASGPAVLLAIFGLMLILLPLITTMEQGRADELVRNIMFTAKELYVLEQEE
mgnify:CR=1 FL=1